MMSDEAMVDARMMQSRLAPDRIRIRHAEPRDFEAVAATMATPNAVAGTLQLPMPSLELWRERMAKPEPGGAHLVAEVRDPDARDDVYTIVGNLGLHPISPNLRRRHAMSLGMSVRDDWQGRGIGTALMNAVIDRADNWMNVLRIELTVFADNEAACALYRRFGFVVEGTHRAYALRDGVYVDAYAMARLHPNPPMMPVPLKGNSP